jgi:hypothetical protein
MSANDWCHVVRGAASGCTVIGAYLLPPVVTLDMFDHLSELNRHAKFMRDGVTVRLDSALRALP